MRRLLTTGIKAIVAIAILSTATHWALRVQREPEAPASAVAAIPDPATTGSITPRKVERAAALPAAQPEAAADKLDQQHLMKLIAGAAGEKPKPQKAIAKR